jgi:hypothetical protein
MSIKINQMPIPSFKGYLCTLSVASCCLSLAPTGTDVMIIYIFSPKHSAKKLAFLTQNKAKLCKILIITLVFEKNANFFAENCQTKIAENCDHNIDPR